MTTLSVSQAGTKLQRLLNDATGLRRPIEIRGKRSTAVLIPADEWRAIQETLFLLSIPHMRQSIRRGLKTPLSNCSKVLKW